MRKMIALLLAASVLFTCSCAKKIKVGPEDARVIAKNAYIYGYPMIENYKYMYAYAVYKDSGHFRVPFNTLAVVTPDTARTDSTGHVVAPTPPYALAWLDMRTEPVVITVPRMKEGSHFDIQLIDLYTFHFGEISTEKNGNEGGSYLIVPAMWSSRVPDKINGVIGCETSFALAIIHGSSGGITATAAKEDFLMSFNVEKQSTFEGTKTPPSGELIFPPYSQETVSSAGFFQYMNFLLQFCPVHPSEIHERADFAKLGIAPGKNFDIAYMNKDILAAVNAGMNDGRDAIAAAAAKTAEGQAKYGSRAELKNDFLARAVAAHIQLYGPAGF